MMKPQFLSAMVLAGLFAATALHGLEVPLPFKPQEIAARAKQEGLPDGLSVSAEGNALKIAARSALAFEKAVTITQTANVPPQAAGRDAVVKIKVYGRNLDASGTTVSVGDRTLPLPSGNFPWKSVSAKIKCPANGKLPVTICLRKFSGTLMLQEPTAQIVLPGKLPANLKRKRR